MHTIHLKGGSPTTRAGGGPASETLVLNPERSLVVAAQLCLTDGRGVTVLRMLGAEAKVRMLKRGATIYWNQSGLGRLSVDVKCNSPLKFDRLRDLLPQREKQDAGRQAPLADVPSRPQAERQPERPAEPQLIGSAPYTEVQPYAEEQKPEKRSWWRSGRKASKWDRGNYEGTNLAVTKGNLDTRLRRFDEYAFEGVCANLLAAMGYKIEKWYNASTYSRPPCQQAVLTARAGAIESVSGYEPCMTAG